MNDGVLSAKGIRLNVSFKFTTDQKWFSPIGGVFAQRAHSAGTARAQRTVRPHSRERVCIGFSLLIE